MLRRVTVEQVAAAADDIKIKKRIALYNSCDSGTVDSILTTCTVCFTVFSHFKETNKWCSGEYTVTCKCLLHRLKSV